jgi:hypothetical protein
MVLINHGVGQSLPIMNLGCPVDYPARRIDGENTTIRIIREVRDRNGTAVSNEQISINI